MPGMYRVVGNPWIETLIIDKAAQRGFTECMVAFMAFGISEIRVPCAFGFEAEGKLRDIVNPRIQPSFDYTEPIKKLREERFAATRRKDTDFQQRKITAGGIELTLFYTSTVSSGNNKKAEAPSSMRSFPCMIGAGDEVELWSEKAIGIFRERFMATQLPSKPLRLGSTPGFEGGVVDSQVKQSGRLFEWHIVCPSCQQEQALHPLGNFLKPVWLQRDDGVQEKAFWDAVGKPLKWFSSQGVPNGDTQQERDLAIDTAYIGCSHCDAPLSWEVICKGEFKDGSFNETADEFEQKLLKDQKPFPYAVALRVPTLAFTNFNPVERIRLLINAVDPTDQYQQGLGLAVSIGGGKIELDALRKCSGRKPIDVFRHYYPEVNPEQHLLGSKPDLVVMGIDQGKAFHWVCIQHWWLPPNSGKDEWDQRWKKAIKQVVWYGEAAGFDSLQELIDKWEVNLIGCDGEPEYEKCSEFALTHPIYPEPHVNGRKGQFFRMDQVNLKGQKFKTGLQEIQREMVPVFALHRSFGLDCVRNRIYRHLQCMPDGLTYSPGDEQNVFYHYLSSTRSNEGAWTKTPGAPDHWFHADNFAEMAVYISGYHQPHKSELTFVAMDP